MRVKDSSGHEIALARAIDEMRLAYRDPGSWPSLMALERRRTLTGERSPTERGGGESLRLAIARPESLQRPDGLHSSQNALHCSAIKGCLAPIRTW
jgi:hypothetical protein